MRRWTLGKYHVRFRFPLLASRALVPCFGGRSHDSCPLGVVVQSVNGLYAFCASVALVEALARKQKKKKRIRGGAMCSESYRTRRRVLAGVGGVCGRQSRCSRLPCPTTGKSGRVRRQCGSLGFGRAGGKR